jgi:hypothetical protein
VLLGVYDSGGWVPAPLALRVQPPCVSLTAHLPPHPLPCVPATSQEGVAVPGAVAEGVGGAAGGRMMAMALRKL